LAVTDLAHPGVCADPEAFIRPDETGLDRIELLVRGARCAGCLRKIETTVGALPDVGRARFNLTTHKLSVAWRPGRTTARRIVEALDDLGYAAVPFDPAEARAEEDREGRRLAVALGVAGFGVMNVMMFTTPVWTGQDEMGAGVRTLLYWLAAVVATPCALFAGRPFFQSAWASLRRGRANMDVPISIAVILTLAVSFSETLQHGAHAYFDAAVMLLFLLLIGRYLDHRLRARARSAARDLLALQAPTASRFDEHGALRSVPAREVRAGDRLLVAPGERVPVDGTVLEGRSDLDLSLVTGETAPGEARPGARLHAGALNLTGALVLSAEAAADESTVAEVARLMEAGAQSKSRYVRLADKAAGLYVPVVHLLALATFVSGWALGLGAREAVLRAAAVLIVTCPCALGLAVPAVQVAACGRLFRKGVLVKSGAALERLAEVRHVVFDKTGVITEGRPRLVGAAPADLSRAAPLARASRHPLARALAAEVGSGPAAEAVTETPGLGVEGLIGGRRARLGRAEFVGAEPLIELGPSAGTELWFGLEGEPPVRFRFEDATRPEAHAAVAALRARGLTVEILSGDVEAAVARAARAVGVHHWRSALTPIGKAAIVDQLAAGGIHILMVGDGLNDAAALAKAHASMAPGSAVDASQNAADLVFEHGRLSAVVEAIDEARRARRRALENFAFSAVYNLVAAPAAIAGLVTPLLAAVAMSASSLAVTLNAMRPERRGPKP
jgi:Cu2+-exporting ATPase